MSNSRSAGTARRLARSAIVTVVVVVGGALVGILGSRSLAGWSSSAASPIAAERSAHPSHGRLHADGPGDPPDQLRSVRNPALGVPDGEVPDGVTVFDDEYPAVANLDPAFLRALRRAATDAEGDGVEIIVNSGWRSRTYQERLFEQAVSKYGSDAEAAQWVARPGTSVHESGDAVDIGPDEAAAWLSEHGAGYGLCQTYGNEPWHYELRPEAVDQGCPPTYADPTHDPRMQQ